MSVQSRILIHSDVHGRLPLTQAAVCLQPVARDNHITAFTVKLKAFLSLNNVSHS